MAHVDLRDGREPADVDDHPADARRRSTSLQLSPGMKRALVILIVALAAATVAEAQPPEGIVRPPSEKQLGDRELGAQLYAGNCASCHGIAGEGSTGRNSSKGSGDI